MTVNRLENSDLWKYTFEQLKKMEIGFRGCCRHIWRHTLKVRGSVFKDIWESYGEDVTLLLKNILKIHTSLVVQDTCLRARYRKNCDFYKKCLTSSTQYDCVLWMWRRGSQKFSKMVWRHMWTSLHYYRYIQKNTGLNSKFLREGHFMWLMCFL